MTDLVERMARVISSECRNGWDFENGHCNQEYECWCRHDLAPAAIAIVLEEAAKVAENFSEGNPIPTTQRQ